MQRDSFIFYRSFWQATKPLNKEQKADLYDCICSYALGNELEPINDPILEAMFSLIKPQLEANLKRYKNGLKGAEHGKKGGRPKTPKKPLTNPKLTPNVNVNVNDNVNVNVNDNENLNVNKNKKNSRGVAFAPPTLKEIEDLFKIKINNQEKAALEAEIFYNFYGSKNWMIGKSKMKSYKMAVGGWISRKKQQENETKSTSKEQRIKQLQDSSDRNFGVVL